MIAYPCHRCLTLRHKFKKLLFRWTTKTCFHCFTHLLNCVFRRQAAIHRRRKEIFYHQENRLRSTRVHYHGGISSANSTKSLPIDSWKKAECLAIWDLSKQVGRKVVALQKSLRIGIRIRHHKFDKIPCFILLLLEFIIINPCPAKLASLAPGNHQIFPCRQG